MRNDEDPIDKFFKSAADHLREDFRESDWAAMEKMLIEQERHRLVWKRVRTGGIAAGVVALVLIGSYFINNVNHQASSMQNQLQPKQKAMEKVVSSSQNIAPHKKTNSMNFAAMASKQNANVSNKEIDSVVTKEFPTSQIRPASRHDHVHPIEKLPVQMEAAVQDSFVMALRSDTGKTVLRKEIDTERPRWKKLPWAVSMIFSPDFTTVNMKEFTTPGETAGLMVFAPISGKFSAGIGVLRSHKNYRASEDAYHFSDAYWLRYTNGVKPEKINGSCTIIEVPLVMRYQINFHHSNVYATAGVSSYYMFDQSYRYLFGSQGNTNGVTGKDPPGSLLYLFKVANFSFGYERYVSRNMLVGIEPFVKLPLADMGWTNVKLYSGGLFLTLRYQFNRKTKTD